MKKKIAAGMLVISLLAMAACTMPQDEEGLDGSGSQAEEYTVASIDEDEPGGGKWRDSDIMGSVKEGETIRPEDDFAAAVNQEWITGQTQETSGFMEVQERVFQKKQALLDDPSLDSKEAMELKQFANLASDWEARNKDGAAPLKGYLDGISAIQTVEDYLEWRDDPAKNPLSLGLVVNRGVFRTDENPDYYTVLLAEPEHTLSDEDSYLNLLPDALEEKLVLEEEVAYILGKLGVSHDEAKQAVYQCYQMERKMIEAGGIADDGDGLEETIYSFSDIEEAAGTYPVGDYLRSHGMGRCDHFAADIKYIKNASRLLQEKNIPLIKAMLTVKYVLESAYYLDRDTYDEMERLEKPRTQKPAEDLTPPQLKEPKLLFDVYIGGCAMSAVMDKLYLDEYVKEADCKRMEGVVSDIIEEYRSLFADEEWMSDDGKEKTLEKLNALIPQVEIPDYEEGMFDGLEVTGREEGGSFLDAVFAMKRFEEATNEDLLAGKYRRDKWNSFDQQMSTTQTNAFYYPQMNAIFILAGILEEPIYRPDMSYEEMLGGIGAIVGHEITHGFDKNGAEYDKDGLENEWMPFMDRQKFNDRCDTVAQYYSLIHPYPGSGMYMGDNVTTEATADMGGLAVVLRIASHTKDFDYDRFFTQFATIYRANYTRDTEKNLLETDVHPLQYLRINVGLQQFDEFMETYHIKKKDGMYLSPAERILVW